MLNKFYSRHIFPKKQKATKNNIFNHCKDLLVWWKYKRKVLLKDKLLPLGSAKFLSKYFFQMYYIILLYTVPPCSCVLFIQLLYHKYDFLSLCFYYIFFSFITGKIFLSVFYHTLFFIMNLLLYLLRTQLIIILH